MTSAGLIISELGATLEEAEIVEISSFLDFSTEKHSLKFLIIFF